MIAAVEETQVRGRDRLAGHHDHQALDDVAQLADVARPAIALKAGRRARIEPLRPTAVFARELGHEMLGQQRDVAWPVAQRRHGDRDDVQPEVEVLAESRGADLGRQILVGRGQHAHVHPHACCPADRLDDLLLQRAQDLGLRLQAHVADLVEKQRAAVGELELAAPIRGGAGERPLDVAEQLALDQLFRNRGAVHLDERPGPPAAHRVNAPGDELLAGAVLAVDQHPTVGRRCHGHLLAQLRHRVALAHHPQPAIDVGSQCAILGFEPPLTDGVADDEDGLLERERLFDEIVRAQFDRAHRRFDVAVTEIITTGASTRRSRSRARVTRPSIPGSQMSSTMTSYGARATRSRHASPESTVSTSYPSSRRTPLSALRTPASSSTMRTVGFMMRCVEGIRLPSSRARRISDP